MYLRPKYYDLNRYGIGFPKKLSLPVYNVNEIFEKIKTSGRRPDDVRTNPTVQETSATFLATGKNNSKLSSVYLRPKYYDLNRYGIGFPKKLSLPVYNVIENFFKNITSGRRPDVVRTFGRHLNVSQNFWNFKDIFNSGRI